jgi:hypothetical protein
LSALIHKKPIDAQQKGLLWRRNYNLEPAVNRLSWRQSGFAVIAAKEDQLRKGGT